MFGQNFVWTGLIIRRVRCACYISCICHAFTSTFSMGVLYNPYKTDALGLIPATANSAPFHYFPHRKNRYERYWKLFLRVIPTKWHSIWQIFDILSGIHSVVPFFWHSFWHSIWHILWHSIWHSIWRSIWHSIWDIFIYIYIYIFWHSIRPSFWHSIWDFIWRSIWHSIWYILYLKLFFTFYLASILAFFWRVFGPRRAQLHPELEIGFGSMRAQTELEFAMSFWHLLWPPSPLVPTVTTRLQKEEDAEKKRGRGRGEGGVAPLLKSRDPHLAVGEIYLCFPCPPIYPVHHQPLHPSNLVSDITL